MSKDSTDLIIVHDLHGQRRVSHHPEVLHLQQQQALCGSRYCPRPSCHTWHTTTWEFGQKCTPRLEGEVRNGTPRPGCEVRNGTPRPGCEVRNGTPRPGCVVRSGTPRPGGVFRSGTPRPGGVVRSITPQLVSLVACSHLSLRHRTLRVSAILTLSPSVLI